MPDTEAIGPILAAVKAWARSTSNVRALGLAGSWARGTARPDSDIDLILVVNDRAALLRDTAWIDHAGAPSRVVHEDWGAVQAVRSFYENGHEIEYGLGTVEWAAVNPVDPGTARVVGEGFVALYDPDWLLAELIEAARHAERTTGAVDAPNRSRDTVVEYDPRWPNLFEQLRRRVKSALDELDASVEHVGSTAVPGLAGKSIIDMDVVVRDPSDVATAIERLVSLDYTHQGDLGVRGRAAFSAPPGSVGHHLYVVVEGSKPHRDHVDLREYLRHHPEEAHRYAAKKYELAHLLATNREDYTAAKRALVEDLLRRARDRPSP